MRRLHRILVKTDAVRTLPTGGISVDAVLCRPGVLQYQRPDGSVLRELRPPEVVASPSAVASLKGATVTVLHPDEQRITTENYRSHVVGVVADAIAVDGQIIGTVHIHDQATIDAIASGQLLELSPGYTVDLCEQPGTDPEFGSYDAITASMEFNHVSLLPPGAGRQGPQVALRLDAAGHVIVDSPTMDPEQLKAMIAEMMPDMDAALAQVSEQAMAALKEMLPALIAEAMAGKAEEPATDADLETPTDADPEAAIDPERVDPADEGITNDEDLPLEERVDSRLLDAIRAVERVTGQRADLSLSLRALLADAAKAAKLNLRSDASADRLLGALEAVQAAPKAPGGLRQDSAPQLPRDEDLTANERNERRIAAMARGDRQ